MIHVELLLWLILYARTFENLLKAANSFARLHSFNSGLANIIAT